MGLFDKLPGFGKTDPLDDVLDNIDSDDGDPEITPEDERTAGNPDWPYHYTEAKSENLAGNQVKSHSPDGTVYAGSYVRSMIEDRRYNPEGYTWFGYTKHPVRGVEAVGVPHESLFRHTALFGVTGFGKSTVMKNMMLQWIHAGYGMCFIDPKGDDSPDLMRMIPEHRKEDIVWVELGQTDREKVIGFNFFDTHKDPGEPGFENEVDEIVSDFVGILQGTNQGWGATIENVARAVTKQLVKAEDSYNVVDLYKILNNEEEREAFAQHFGDDVEQMYLNRLAEMETDEFDPIIRRVREWVENSVTREVIAHEGSQLNLAEAVKQGKILIINTSDIPDKNVKRLISTAVIRRIWSTIRTRSNIPKPDRDPYFLCVDEFDQVAGENSDIEDILSKARSLRMSVFVANQQPNQLPGSIKDAIFGNCDNLFTFNPGPANFKDAKPLSQTLGDVETHKLLGLSQFRLLGRITIGTDKTDPMLIHTFPEYPPIRSREAAERLMKASIEKYGSEREIDTADTDGYGIIGRLGEDNTVGFELNDEGDRITPNQVLECVYAARIRHETKEFDGRRGWVHEDDLREEIQKYAGNIGYESVLDNILEQIPDAHLESELDGDVYFRLTAEGEQRAFVQDTGSSASGGKNAHRVLLQEGHRAFTKLGYDVTLPTQDGDDLPDGIAQPPYDPVKDSDTFDEAEELRERLKDEYPRIWQLFGDQTVSLEAESTTITRPAQTLKNLAKAARRGQKCVFLVKDGTAKHDSMEHWARAGTNILTDPPCVADADENGNRVFYNTSQLVGLDNGEYALQRIEDGESYNCVWTEVGGNADSETDKKIALQRDGDEPLATFDDASDLRNPSTGDFPYHYYRDNERRVTIVKDRSGRTIKEYDNKKQMKKDGFRPIYKPLIPEHEFPNGDIPDPNSWMFVIIPSSNRKSDGPMIYDQGTLIPLFNGDLPSSVQTADRNKNGELETLSSDLSPDGKSKSPRDRPTQNDGNTTSETQSTSPDDEEPRVSGEGHNLSTNEVVKNSDDVWTKPDKEDDDYNPAKDNSNYRVGYNEDHVSGDFTGGRARELDENGDFDDYEIPTREDTDSTDDSVTEAIQKGLSENEGTPPTVTDKRDTDSPEETDPEQVSNPNDPEENTDNEPEADNSKDSSDTKDDSSDPFSSQKPRSTDRLDDF